MNKILYMMAMVIAMQFFIACTESDDIFVDPVEPMSAVSEAGVWFDLFGRKLPGKPTAPGWYINDGKKIAITK